MKSSLVLAVAVLTVVVSVRAYTTKYDGVDLDQILNNERLLIPYTGCLLEKPGVTCTPDGKELKEAIPDALTNGCASCNEKQKDGAHKVIRFIIKNKPELWKELEAKYDPSGIYQKQYQDELKEISS